METANSSISLCFSPFKISVKKGSYAIAILGIVGSIFCGIFIFSMPSKYFMFNTKTLIGISALVGIMLSASTIFGLKKGDSRFFKPYLFCKAIGSLYGLIMLFVFVGLFITAPQAIIDFLNNQIPELEDAKKMDVDMFRMAITPATVCLTISLFTNPWQFLTVLRAYKHSKNVEVQRESIEMTEHL